jgi:hypothetical protein
LNLYLSNVFIPTLIHWSLFQDYQNIWKNTIGVIFFSTPHFGSKLTGYDKVQIQPVLLRLANSFVTDMLKKIRAMSIFSSGSSTTKRSDRFAVPKQLLPLFYRGTTAMTELNPNNNRLKELNDEFSRIASHVSTLR